LADCWRSRLFDRNRPPWPGVTAISRTLAGRLLCPWPTQIVIPTTLAPETGEVSWDSMGLRRVLFIAKVYLHPSKSQGSHPARKLLSLRSSSVEYRQPSRDVPTFGPNRLELPHDRQSTSGSSGLDPLGLGPMRHLSTRRSVMSHRLWFPDLLRQPRWLQS
jgi:hypothetical protein